MSGHARRPSRGGRSLLRYRRGVAALALLAELPLAATRPGDLPVPEAGGEGVRRAVEEILARPEFGEPPRTILERLRDWALDQLGRLLGQLVGAGGTDALTWVVVVVLALAAVAFAVRFSTGLRGDPGAPLARPGRAGRAAVDWRAEARAHEAAGQWRAAVRCHYRALIAELAGRGLVEEVPGRTSGEYRRAVRSALPDTGPDVDRVTALFEGAWYGNQPTGPHDAARARDLADRVLAGEGSAP